MPLHIHLATRYGMDFIAVGQQQQVGMTGVSHQRIDRVADGDPQAAVGNALQPFAALGNAVGQAGDQGAGNIGGVGQRIGNGVVT